MSNNQVQIVLSLGAAALLMSASYFGFAWAETGQSSSASIQIKATDEIKKDPGMMSILEKIELFKQQYAAQQQKQESQAQQKSLVDEQRKIASDNLKADLTKVANDDLSNPKIAFSSFVSKVDSSAQNVFWDQFGYMQSKAAMGRLAMTKVLQNGGTIEEALKAYSDAASIQKTDLVSVNKSLNIKYHLADETIQDQFTKYGTLKKYAMS
jgi:hypothetical protein